MPLESATYISDLVVSNPANSDGLNQADDHMRLIKAAVKATFPNFTSAALASTQADIDAAVIAANAVTARNGSVPAGAIMDFAMSAVPTGWLECTGAAVSRTTYAALFSAISTTWGAGDGSTTFNLPPDRYRRGRNAAGVAVGSTQADQNKAHTHGVSGTTATDSNDHSHTYSGTTSSMNRNNPHAHTGAFTSTGASVQNAVNGAIPVPWSAVNTGSTDINHEHTYSGTTSGISAAHAHTFSVTSAGGSADGAEARPSTAVFVTCIKT